MPLRWSDERGPCEDCRYNHIVAETPFGPVYIEWKGWKPHDAPGCIPPWGQGKYISGDDVPDAIAKVQASFDAMAEKVAELKSS